MARGIQRMKEVESVERIIELLRNTSHNGFPAVAGDLPLASSAAFRGSRASLEVNGGDAENEQMLWGQDEPNALPGALKGIILRSQLLVLLTKRVMMAFRGPSETL